MESCKFRNHPVGPKTYRMDHRVFVSSPVQKSCFRENLNCEKNRSISLEPVRHPQKVSMCHLNIIPIHFLEPEIGPTKCKNH